MSAPRANLLFAWLVRVAVFSCLAGHGVFAQLTNAPTSAALPTSTTAALSVLRVFGALALVIAVFFGGLWVVRNWQRFAARQGRAPKLAVFETKVLGQRHTLYVIGYEQERMLIAASPTGVAMLSALPRAEAVEPSVISSAPASLPVNFSALLQGLAGRS